MNVYAGFDGLGDEYYDDGPYDDQFELGNDHHLLDEPAPQPCIYFDQPGHTLDQKPHPRVYSGGFGQLPMCANCNLRVQEGAR